MRRVGRRSSVPIVSALVLATACASGSGIDVPDGVELADGWSAEVVRDDLDGPTQLTVEQGSGLVAVAELAGREDAGLGRVRVLGADARGDAVRRLDDLLTPTGVALTTADGGTGVVQEQRRLVRLATAGDPPPGPGEGLESAMEVLVAERPFNGRSQGTLTLLPDGTVLATATGSGTGPDVPSGSGVLLAVPAALAWGRDVAPVTIAVGFKNAYGHTVDEVGTLWVTEIGDGTYDGEAPPDELYSIPAATWQATLDDGAAPFDGGWPRCTGAGDPTEELGATLEECAALPAPVATFPPRATPTSVAVTTDGRVLVALWVEGRVVEVDPTSGLVTDVVTGLEQPQHLLAHDDGTVLLTVHGAGELWRLTPPSR